MVDTPTRGRWPCCLISWKGNFRVEIEAAVRAAKYFI